MAEADIRLRMVFDEAGSKSAQGKLDQAITAGMAAAKKQASILGKSTDAEEITSAKARLVSANNLIDAANAYGVKERNSENANRAEAQRGAEREQERTWIRMFDKKAKADRIRQDRDEGTADALAFRDAKRKDRNDLREGARLVKDWNAQKKARERDTVDAERSEERKGRNFEKWQKNRWRFWRQGLHSLQRQEDRAEDYVGERRRGRGMARALGGFGGKMVLGRAAGMMAGEISGSGQLGSEVGNIASAFVFGNAGIGALVVGMQAVGASFRVHYEALKASREAAKEYGDILSHVSDKWRDLGLATVGRNSFGQAMQGQAHESLAAVVPMADKMAEAIWAGPGLWERMSAGSHRLTGFGTAIGDSAWGKNLTGMDQQRKLQSSQADSFAAFSKAEYPEQVKGEERIAAAQKGIYAASQGRTGLLKEERVLSAKIAADDEKRHVENEAERRKADHAVSAAKEMADRMHAQGIPIWNSPSTNQGEKQAATDRYHGALAAWTEAKEAQNQLGSQQERRENEAGEAHAGELTAQQVRYQEALRNQTNQTAEAKVAAEHRGYAQTVALQEESFRVQMDNAKQNGHAMVDLVDKQQADLRKVRQRGAREGLEGGMAAWSPMMAQRAFGRRMEDAKAQGATPDELDAIKKEELTGQYIRSTAEARLELAVKRRKMTMKEADIARAMLADPKARMAGAEGDAVRKSIAENAEARDALRWAPRNPGQFSTRFQAGFVNTSVLDQTPRRDALTTAREQLQIQKFMSDTLTRIAQRGGLN